MADGIQSEETDIVTDIVDGLAAARGADPLELSPPLERVVDTDALKRLVECDAMQHVEFEYGDYVVTVDGDRSVTVVKADVSVPTIGR